MTTVARPSHESSAHWYQTDGKPMHTIMGKTTGRPRNVTIRDARELGLLPGVSTILKVLRAPALEAWKVEQAILSSLTLPRNPGEDEHSFAQRVIEDMGKEAETARDIGSEIHAAIAGVLSGTAQCPPHLEAYVAPVIAELSEYKVLWTERVLVGAGYAGTTDLGCERNGAFFIVDFKSCSTLPKESWWEHQMQSAGYAMTIKDYPLVQTCNIYIDKKNPGQIKVCIQEDWTRAAQAFQTLVTYWQITNNL